MREEGVIYKMDKAIYMNIHPPPSDFAFTFQGGGGV